MSRIGKAPVSVPKEVKVAVDKSSMRVEGPKGKLSLAIPNGVTVEQKDGKVFFNRVNDSKENRAKHGTMRALLASMIVGVTQGHKKELEVQGLGFRVQVQGNKLIGNLGLSHQVEFPVPVGVTVTTPKPTEIKIEGIDKALVGQVAANIRFLKRTEPYKGKGIRYVGEIVRRKQGKAVSK